MSKFAVVVCLLALTACSSSRLPTKSVHEVSGNGSERVTRVSAIIAKNAKNKALPTAVIDAHFVEEQIGDGVLGPSDFRAFCVVEVAPQDISKWTPVLTPLGTVAEYGAPEQPREWWISREAFASLQFFSPEVLTGRIHGWIGVSQQTGRIYIFTFTT